MAKKAARKTLDASLPVFQLTITLEDIEPAIYRRIETHGCTLADLHEIIQTCMGWDGDHLHAFEVGRKQYTDLSMGGDSYGARSSRSVRLSSLVERGECRFVYEYDFGDSWRHLIEIEKTLPAEENVRYPRCLDGQRACPPDDCGGSYGYYRFLEALQNPEDEDNAERLEWLGDDFDPEEFDLDDMNRQLRYMRRWLGQRPPAHKPAAQFAVGDRVRVRPGVPHSEYTDLPLGGWLGTVTKIVWLLPLSYEVRWSDETLAAAHPVYAKRCQRDDERPERHWLVEAELEADAPERPLELEQPTNLIVMPLSADNADDRVRMVFGLTSDDPLPPASEENERHYLEYLQAHLTFPFDATHWSEAAIDAGKPDSVAVVGLAPSPVDLDRGLLCEVRQGEETKQIELANLHLDDEHPNSRHVDDYMHWRREVRDSALYDNEDDEEYWDDEEDGEEDDEEYEDADEEYEDDDEDIAPRLLGDRDPEYAGPQPIRREQPPVGRNDPCPCGSGKKFKKCCLKKQGGGLLE